MAVPDGDPVYFDSPEEMRAWLEANHESAGDLWVAIYKKGSGKERTLTVPQAQDVGMCFGWVDSLARKIDDAAYKLRFTPRRPRSSWTEANVARAAELHAEGLMHESGLRALADRKRD